MITTTAGQIIAASMKLIGVLAASEAPTASEQQDALLALNGLVDTWGTYRLTMLSVARYAVNLVSGQQSYTIGDGGDFDFEPPLEIDHVGLIYPGTTPPNEHLLDLLTDDQYAAIQLKTMDNPLPQAAYYARPTATLGTMYFWPAPSQDLTVALYVPNALTQFSALNEEVTLAPAYYMALRFNLATVLYPEYGITPRGDVVQTAMESLAALKRANTRLSDLSLDPALMGCRAPYNIFSDTP